MIEQEDIKSEEIKDKRKEYNDDAYSELLLKYIIRDATVLEAAKNNELVPDDLVLSRIAGTQTYKEIAKVVLEADCSPITREQLEVKLKNKGDKLRAEPESITEYLDYVYNQAPLEPTIIVRELPEFLKHRRYHKVLTEPGDDPDALRRRLIKVHDDVQYREAKSNSITLSPFDELVPQRTVNTINLGIKQIDAVQGGIALGEMGLIIGHSSSGKTAFASWIASQAALAGNDVLYLSAEEPAAGIVARWYAHHLNLEYTKLYRGQDEMGKQQAFRELPVDKLAQLRRLRVVDVRNMVPLTAESIRGILEQKAKEGIIPKVVIMDQMDYMEADKPMPKQTQRWAVQQQIAFECDLLSQYKIKGEHEFALWIVHQGTGERKWMFGFNDIAGSKGIVRPFDTAIGVGREPREEGVEDKSEEHVNIFSMKIRHSQHFAIPMLGVFSHMRFEPAIEGFKPKSVKDKEERKAATKKMTRTGGRENPIPETAPPPKPAPVIVDMPKARTAIIAAAAPPKKRMGRPKGSKNKPKPTIV